MLHTKIKVDTARAYENKVRSNHRNRNCRVGSSLLPCAALLNVVLDGRLETKEGCAGPQNLTHEEAEQLASRRAGPSGAAPCSTVEAQKLETQ